MIDLTLNAIQIPAIAGYTPPFGTKKASGGLSTQETNDNIISPFVRQRPVVVSESASTSQIQYNATLVITTAGITLTLGSGAYVGCEVTIVSTLGGSIAYTGKIGSVTDHIQGGVVVKYMWMGSYWMSVSAPVAIGDVYAQMPDVPAPSLLYGGQWQEHPYAGMFMRSQGGNAKVFTPPIAGSFSSSTVFTASAALPAGVAVGDLVVSGSEYKTITAISGRNITINSAFSNYQNITNLLIGQSEALPNIIGSINTVLDLFYYYGTSGHTGALRNVKTVDNVGYSQPSSYKTQETGIYFDASLSNSVYKTGAHVQPNTLIIRYWLRSA